MKRYISLLLALVMVVGLIPTIGVLATEENTTPAVIEENFDDIALEAPDVNSIPGFTANGAQIKPAPGRTGSALWVGDEAKAATSSVSYSFESTSNVTVEFDINAFDTNSLGGLKLYNGTMTDATTALWLNFNPNGLRYFDKPYSDYQDKATTTTTANTWITVRIELTTGAEGKANVYFNNALVLEVPAPTNIGTNAPTVNGICFQAASAAKSFYLDNLKITPAPYVATYKPTAATDFEDMEVGAAAGAPAIGVSQATVVAEDDSNKVVHLNDTADTSAASLGLRVEDSESLDLDFKYMGVNGALQMYITYGDRNTANTAYFLQFLGKNVQYYDVSTSKWATLATLDSSMTNWTDLSIEATTTAAKIYAKGKLVGEVSPTGGSYGTKVTNVLNSVYFMTGSSKQVTNNNCYIDNVSLSGNARKQQVTPSVACDFESMTVGAAPTAPAQEVKLATVQNKQYGTAVQKSVLLSDKDTTAAGNMRIALPEKTARMVAEFDLTASAGPMQFNITNGPKSDANAAYMLKIQGTNVQYHNGTSWTDMKTLDAFLGNTWHKIRIEADLEGADFYLDDVLLGRAGRCIGGNYGKNVTDSFDSLVFVCGGVSDNNTVYYVDNVKVTGASYDVIVTPDVIEENFDAYYASASVENVEGIVASTAVEIVANPSGEGNALMLHDKTGAAFGTFDYAFDLVDNYILEYDAFIPTSANDVCMQIHAGLEGNKMAYVLAFNRAYGLRVFTGSADTTSAWVNLEETATKLTPNAWNKIRVEVNTGKNNEAAIYLNDELIAVTSEAYGRKNDVVGANIYSGAANQYVYIDNLKVTVVEPEDEGIDGIVDTEVGLMLEKDVTIDTMTIDAGTTLDLNGYALTVTDLVVYGSIIDTSEGSTGKLVSENALFLGEEMEYMPIYDSANGCYKFYTYELKNLGARANANGTVTYGFAIDFANADAYALLASGDCGVKVNMNLTWGENSLPFVFDAALVQQYADLQAKYTALRVAMMLTVSGVDTLEAGETLSVVPAVEAAGMVNNGDAMVYTVS